MAATVSAAVNDARDRLRVYTDYLFELTPQRLQEQSGGWSEIAAEARRATRWVREYTEALAAMQPLAPTPKTPAAEGFRPGGGGFGGGGASGGY